MSQPVKSRSLDHGCGIAKSVAGPGPRRNGAGSWRQTRTPNPEARERSPGTHQVDKIIDSKNIQRIVLDTESSIYKLSIYKFNPSVQTHLATQPKPSSSHPHVQPPIPPHNSHKTQDGHLHEPPSMIEPATTSFQSKSNPRFHR